jgi:cell division protein FtsW
MKAEKIDRFFFILVTVLVTIGLFAFVSASLGVLAKDESKFYGILIKQIALGLVGGSIALFITQKIHYKFWRNNSFWIFLGCILLTVLVFVPQLTYEHGGARRWIEIGFISFQPAELLKFGFVLYFAAWLASIKGRVTDMKFSIIPLAVLLGIVSILLLKQPDTKSFILIIVSALGMLLAAGVPWKYILGVVGISVLALGGLVMAKPYLLDRVETFINPSHDPRGSSYQLRQSLIAIGSGGVTGRGYGQSIQKFSYLPEPQGDSIFAVIGEEMGFIGSVVVILLYVLFTLRGFRIAVRSPDQFSRLLVTGIILMMAAQSFLNIASIIGVFPLTGVPLVFMSHGGTSLLISLAAIGIILNISKYQREKAL